MARIVVLGAGIGGMSAAYELRAGGTALLDAHLPAGTREVVLVCQSGMRSRVAQAILSGDPTRTYLNLAGGMAAWQSHGLPIVRHD